MSSANGRFSPSNSSDPAKVSLSSISSSFTLFLGLQSPVSFGRQVLVAALYPPPLRTKRDLSSFVFFFFRRFSWFLSSTEGFLAPLGFAFPFASTGLNRHIESVSVSLVAPRRSVPVFLSYLCLFLKVGLSLFLLGFLLSQNFSRPFSATRSLFFAFAPWSHSFSFCCL